MKNSEFVTNWVIEQVKTNYVDDIALVVSHTTLRIEDKEDAVSFFVPLRKRGMNLEEPFY